MTFYKSLRILHSFHKAFLETCFPYFVCKKTQKNNLIIFFNQFKNWCIFSLILFTWFCCDGMKSSTIVYDYVFFLLFHKQLVDNYQHLASARHMPLQLPRRPSRIGRMCKWAFKPARLLNIFWSFEPDFSLWLPI